MRAEIAWLGRFSLLSDPCNNAPILPHVDVGHGWLIFALPPSEIAVHPAETSGKHELFFICGNVDTLVGQLTAKGVACAAIGEFSWGRVTSFTLPGGGEVGVYEPKHERPPSKP